MLLTWAAEVGYKLVTRQLIFVVNPCHLLCLMQAGFIFGHLAQNPRFDNVTRRPGHSRGPSGFLPVAIEGMSFFKGLFSKEKGTFDFMCFLNWAEGGAQKSQKTHFPSKANLQKNDISSTQAKIRTVSVNVRDVS